MTGFKRHEENEINPEKVWDDDAFQTLEQYADFLTNALTANTENFVLNVNGSWGTGKSFFVERWAEALRQQKHPVVEFNAWENDSAEDPLAPLIAAILDQQKELLPAPMAKKIKENCGKFLLAGGGLIVRAGLKQLVGDKGVDEVNDLLSSGTENELIKLAGNYVDEQLVKQKASDGLKNVLGEFVKRIESDDDHNLPIFIFIDELDRCRPTFAIELLERVKHLLHIDGIKFIISTDTKQLTHSIKAVYGHDFDAYTYLQRFFDETFTLPNPDPHQFSELLFKNFDLDQNWKTQWIVKDSPTYTFGKLSLHLGLTLRQQLQAHHRIMTVVSNTPIPQNSRLHFIFITILVMIRLKYQESYIKLMKAPSKNIEWQTTVSRHELTADIFKFVGEYFILMDHDYDGIFQRLNNYHPDSIAERRNRTQDDQIISEIQRSCANAFPEFTNYPQLVELTETFITNRLENEFEQTNPPGYLEWFEKKNNQTNGMLVKVIRLAKYLRDIKQTFSVKSILLTTLLADQVKVGVWSPDDADELYPDVPTALKTIFNRLDDYLQNNKTMPHIYNPSLPEEDFVRHWDEKKYQNFRKWISFYTTKINAAYEANRDESILLWRQVFGDDFAKGIAVSPPVKSRFDVPHRQTPPWPMNLSHTVEVGAKVYKERGRGLLATFLNKTRKQLNKKVWIRFKATTSCNDFDSIEWQVVNTGRDAGRCLRGDFYPSDDGRNVRWETTLYRGMHWVEAFLISDDECIARSGEFEIKID